MFPKRQRLDDDDNETLHRLSTALDTALGASFILATLTTYIPEPSSNIAAAYLKLGENLGLLPQPATTIATNSTTAIATNSTTPIATNPNTTAPLSSLPPRILDFEQDVTTKHPELHHFRLSIREFALSAHPIFHQIISWVYADYFAKQGSRLELPRVWQKDREFRENLSKNIINVIQNEYPDVHFMRDPLKTAWGCHSRPNSEQNRRNCRKIMLSADLMKTTSKILSGSAEEISPTLSCVIKFLYILTELHELMHFLITKCLTFVDGLTPSLPHTGGYYSSEDSSWGESGFQFEVMMFGFIPAAVWKEGETRVKAIQRLDGYFYYEGKRHYYSLCE
uniref:Uncharacterized protein n=1 Tax=Moniliophthora roreri TaxID=221103 RepID=A0A0W0GCI2_MONRR